MARRSEFDLIADLFAPLATDGAALGLGDDGAVLPAPRGDLVIVKDAVVEGVHFLQHDPPFTVAQKALRANLSDLAAMGARARHYLLALVRPATVSDVWLEELVRGFAADQASFGVSLLGGDTVSTPGPLVLSVTALGEVAPGAALRRRGAVVGDDVWVSGTLGDAALGLAVLRGAWSPGEEAAAALIQRYRVPQPRLALGQELVGLASACQDVSDGLVQDLGHIARQSGVAIVVEAAAVPQSDEAADGPDALGLALTGGDDYELAFTAPADHRRLIQAAAATAGVPVTRIGRTMAGRGVTVVDEAGAPLALASGGWSHRWTR